jgi:hypothetical protein
MILVTTNHP